MTPTTEDEKSDEELDFDTITLTPPTTGNLGINISEVQKEDSKDRSQSPFDDDFPSVPTLFCTKSKMAHSNKKPRTSSKTQSTRGDAAGKNTPKINPFIEAILRAPNKLSQVEATKRVFKFIKSGEEKNACLQFIDQNFEECMMCVVCKKKMRYMYIDCSTKKCYCSAHKTEDCFNLNDCTTISEKK